MVATSVEQHAALEKLQVAGHANGVETLELISAAAAQTFEPNLSCTAALHSPATGIIDSHALMLSLQGDFEAAGGMVASDSPVVSGQCSANGITLQVGAEHTMDLQAGLVVNCAGLHAQEVAHAIAGLPRDSVPALHLAKGNYYSLAGRSPFSRLIYPMPEPGGLGIHLTIDLGGQARFGPDVEWVDHLDYKVDPRRADSFYAAIRRYWPALPDGALQPAYSGIRPKLSGPGEAAADFVIQGSAVHGVTGLINLFGIESPGLTSSLAIAEAVLEHI